jgi:hypothetical protein
MSTHIRATSPAFIINYVSLSLNLWRDWMRTRPGRFCGPLCFLEAFTMSCSSRISRILPAALPLTWENYPADIEPLLPLSISVTDALPRRNRQPNERQRYTAVEERRPASPCISEALSTLPPATSSKTMSINPLSTSLPPKTKDEQNMFESSQHSCEDCYHPVSKPLMEERNVSLGLSRLGPSTEHRPHQGMLKRVCSSPPFATHQDTSPWMTVATCVHRRHSQQNELLSPRRREDSKKYQHRYSHVVRTNALAPRPARNKDCHSIGQPPYQRQPWLNEQNEIDWASYFSVQPLPTAAKWSTLEATVDTVDGTWNPAARILSP